MSSSIDGPDREVRESGPRRRYAELLDRLRYPELRSRPKASQLSFEKGEGVEPFLYLDYIHRTGLDLVYPLHSGNRVRLYDDGRTAFQAMEHAIGTARSSVNLEVYIFAGDECGARIRDLLIACQGRGAQVNLLIDAVGSLETSDEFFDRLRDAGGRVARFSPIFSWHRRRRNPNNRDHRKIMVIDGRVAFLGGMNIGDDYANDCQVDPKAWRDTHARVTGPVVQKIQELFLEHFEWETRVRLVDRPYLREIAHVGRGTTYARVVGGEPGTRAGPLRRAHTYSLRQARRSAFFTTGYFVPPRRLLRALKRAARRGVDVRLLVPGKSDHTIVLLAGQSFYAQLLRAGVRIYEWTQSPLHAKTAVVDGVWGVVGSANLDVRSFELNYEADLHVVGRGIGRFLAATFFRDLSRSREIRLEEWQRRGATRKLAEKFCALFRRFL